MNTEVTVREVMNREFLGVSESDDLVETVELLLSEDAETAVVLHGSEPVGVVTERDVLSVLVDEPDLQTATVADAMSESLPTVAPEETLDEAADRMSAQSVRRLVVVDRGELVGVITEHDLLASRVAEPTADQPTSARTAESALTAEEPEDSYEDQSICEACGAFASDLSSFNGQLVCADCRDM